MSSDFAVRMWPRPHRPLWAAVWPLGAGRIRIFGRRDFWQVDFHSLNLICGGRAIFQTRGKHPVNAELGPGDLFGIPPHTPFRYHSRGLFGLDTIDVAWVRLTGPGAEAFFESAGLRPERPICRPTDADRVRRLIRDIRDLADRSSPDADHRAVAGVYRLAAALNPPGQTSGAARVSGQRIEQFLEEHIAEGITVEAAAEAFGISRSTLYQQCRRELGVSPIELLIRLRTERAAALLTRSDLAVAEIAQQCGYRHVAHFIRQFKASTGQTPGRARRQAASPRR